MPARYYINYSRLNRINKRRGYAIMHLIVAEVRITARRNALYRKFPQSSPGFGVKPLGLAESIYGTLRTMPWGYIGQVGSNLEYAASVEDGASPHIIRPRALSYGGGLYGTGGYLKFYWWRRGRFVRTRMVRHPGQKGKHYIRDALLRTARRRRFRVVLY